MRLVHETEVEGRRPRGRPKRRWDDVCRQDMEELGLTVVEAQDRIRAADPGPPG